MAAVGDVIADKEVGHGGDAEVGHDLDEGIDLVLVAYRAHFQEGKAGMHGQHHNGADKDE